MKKKLVYILFLFVQVGFSQTKQIDSLSSSLSTLDGEGLFQNTNALAETYLEYNPSKALDLVSGILADSKLGDYEPERGKAFYIKGKALSIQANYETSLDFFDEAIAIFQKTGTKNKLAQCYLEKGTAYGFMGRYKDAQAAMDQGEKLFIEIEDRTGLAESFHGKGHLMYLMAEDKKALALYGESLAIHQEQQNTKGISDNYFRMALAHLGLGNRERALDLLVRAKDLKDKIGDHIGLTKVKISLGVLHEENGNPETAIAYYLESYKANRTIGDQRVNSIIFNNLGVTYTDLKQHDSALVYHKKALELRRGLGKPQGIIQSLMNIGEVYQKQQKVQPALKNLREAHALSHASPNKPMLPGVADRLGSLFLDQGMLDSAEVYLQEALTLKKARDNYFSLAITYDKLSALEERRGDFKQALAYHKLFKKVRDSSLLVEANEELAEVQAKYDTERQEREIESLQQENEKRTLWRNIFAIGTLVALGFALLLFQFFVYRNKKNKALLEIEETQRRQLEEMDRMKSRFFSNISHEFRTPLTLILGPIDQLRKSIDGALHFKLDVMERNGRRLLKLINQLLDLSKIESGKITLKTALIDIVPLIKGWVMSFKSLAETKHIELAFVAEQESHFLYVDREKIEEVIINLLSNAFKYTQEDGKITVSLKRLSADNVLSISVTDTGTGISEQELPHVFDRFYQASNADTEDVTGTGIGLALIKELVELHRGTVRVSSRVDKGTTFEILLPEGRSHLKDEEISGIRHVEQEPISRQKTQILREESVETGGQGDGEGKPLVLLIEDNQDLREYIRDILKSTYHFIEAVNGEEGVKIAKERVPDIIISDLMMPKMDGLEVCKNLKEEMLTSHIPIILLTAKSSKEDRLAGLKSLADDYLTKPFDTEELLVRLDNLIALRAKIRAKFKASEMLAPKKFKIRSLDAIFMEKVTKHLEKEMANSLFGVVELAYAVGLSRSQLFRKIKAITDLTPNEYIRSFRLHRAMDILKQNGASVSQAAYETGFQNPSYFSKCFQEQFGMAPSAVKKQ
ncbi:tetratricopeptide repeat protein [Ulvibacterium sp.]|uniref:hybrid sensor histidine kinase/response regulator transcription factor n=1 Tax=Ulvibacterium sp. TaxID=2665914 RepID=UPI003BA964EF